MRFRATAVALSGSALLLAGCGSQPAAAPTTVTVPSTVSKTVSKTVSVTSTITVGTTVPTTVPTTVTETVSAAGGGGDAAGGSGPTGPFSDGTYLVGTDVASGNYKCSNASDDTRWIIEDSAGETLDIDFSSVSRVPANGYTVQFKECGGQWERVG